MFKKILITNRGDVALRVLRACKELDIPSVVVHSTADADSMPVRLADESVCIGPPSSAESYLNIPAILSAVAITGADAVHPGYGFLSEQAGFATALDKAKVAFIGPPANAIAAMGDKIESKKLAKAAGVSTVPGHIGVITTAKEAVKIADKIGYPVMIKASAGGGGKGMRIAHSSGEVADGYATACLLYTSPSPRDATLSRMPSSA